MRDVIAFHALPLAGIDAMSAATVRAFPRHTHDQYGLGSVDAGGHASWSGRGQVEAGPGYFISVNPGEVADRGLHQLFEDAFRYARPHAQADVTMPCDTAILRLVARLRAHSTERPRNETSTACIRRARQRIDSDPAAPVTLLELAKESGLSRYQLIRAFARELGLMPHAYILQRRIALAQQLIRAGCDLAEVAVQAGFYDQSHLTRWFVRQFGVTPSRYCVVAR